jgi:Protein of unknown function (DUF3306)
MSRPIDHKPDEDGNFLSRWAKRKQAVQRAPAETALPDPKPSLAVEGVPPEDLPLPSLDDITPGQDISAFFQKHVPEALRTAALRKLWVTDPDIKGFIEMADYQWDFNNPDSIPGWASKLEGVDIKAMMERVFGGTPSKVEQAEDVLADESSKPGIESIEASEPPPVSAENTAISEKSGAFSGESTGGEPDLIQNGALQYSTEESSVYDTARKRHGSALPT